MYTLKDASFEIAGRKLLSNATTAFEAGSLTAIVGPNGAGKSTLLKLLSGEMRATSGSVHLDGVDVTRLTPQELARRRAVLPQSNPLSFSYTALEIVRLGLENRRGSHVPSSYDDPRDALSAVDLEGFGGRPMHQLSGGEQQRVHLARVLCQIGAPTDRDGARFLLLDEPIASLDIRHQVMVLENAQRFARNGGGVILVLHDLNMAAAFADRLIILDHGRVEGDGSPEAVLTAKRLAAVFGIALAVEPIDGGGLHIHYRGQKPMPSGIAES